MTPTSRLTAEFEQVAPERADRDEQDEDDDRQRLEPWLQEDEERQEPDRRAQDVADHALAGLVRREARRERVATEPPPDDERADVGAGGGDGERGEQRDPQLAPLLGEQHGVDEQDVDEDQPDRRRPEIADRPTRVGPHDRPGDADEHDPADQPVRRRRAEDRDRRDDDDARDLERDPVVERQVHEVRPLEQGDRRDHADEDRDPDGPGPHGGRQDERQRRVARAAQEHGPAVDARPRP